MGTANQLAKARTVAFIALVWSENVRAYTSRSFDKFFVVDLLSNSHMQRAIGLAQAALYLALFLPGLSDVLGLKGIEIDSKGWLAALVGAAATAGSDPQKYGSFHRCSSKQEAHQRRSDERCR